MLKIHGGTPKGSTTLCLSCRSAHVIRGLNLETLIFCRGMANSPRMCFPVAECSIFDDKRVPSLYDMEQVAWHVTSRNRGPVGFEGEKRAEIHIEPPERPSAQPQPANPEVIR